MHDVRFRLAVVFLLSFLSFAVPVGAVFAILWWLIFGAKQTLSKVSWKLIAGIILLAALIPSIVIAFASEISSAGYAVRMIAILLLAFWFGSLRTHGEFFDLFVWLFGNRLGFDAGLSAELSMQALYGIADDFQRQKTALRIKGQKLSIKTLPGIAAGILVLSLSRAENVSMLLARRGYTSGGTYLSEFFPKKSDYAGLCVSLLFTAAASLMVTHGYTLIL